MFAYNRLSNFPDIWYDKQNHIHNYYLLLIMLKKREKDIPWLRLQLHPVLLLCKLYLYFLDSDEAF
jgi:hypothetical protein